MTTNGSVFYDIAKIMDIYVIFNFSLIFGDFSGFLGAENTLISKL
jgi:hypothetical protein